MNLRDNVPDLDLVDDERKAAVVVDHINAQAKRWAVTKRRPAAISAREALVALQFESLVVWTAAKSLAAGTALTDADLERLTLAQQRIDVIVDEVS